MKNLTLFIFLIFSGWTARSQSQLPTDSATLWLKITALEKRVGADFPKTFAEAETVVEEAVVSGCLGCVGRSQNDVR